MSGRKYFGQFLVERKLLSEDDLLDALLEQTRALPPMSEFVKSSGVMGASAILRTFDAMEKDGKDFLSSARSLGYLSEKNIQDVMTKVSQFRKPLGEILLSKKLISRETLVSELDGFLSQKNEPEASVQKLSLEMEQVVDPICEELKEFFTAQKLKQYSERCGQLSPRELAPVLHEIRGYVFLGKMSRVNAILQGIENALRNGNPRLMNQKGELLSSLVHDALSFTWDVAQAVINGTTEEEFVASAEFSQSIAYLVRRVAELKQVRAA